MVGYAKNAPKDEEWLLKEIAKTGLVLGYALFAYNDGLINEEVMNCYRDTYAPEILALVEEGGWVSPADLKDALSRELAAGFRLAVDFSKPQEVNDEMS